MTQCDLSLIDGTTWEVAEFRHQIIRPLLELNNRSKSDVNDIASKNSLHYTTVYSWLRTYEESGLLSSLLPKQRSDKGSTKLNSDIEEIIRETIATGFLSKQKKSKQKVIELVLMRCKKESIKPPHPNTIRNRINTIAPELVARKRLGNKTADNDFKPIQSEFPGADWPLAVVQIDHTKLDIILVDDHYRRPIGRPWITLAFDVFSRMVTGFYVSFDPPNAMAVGLCLSQSILPKDQWLAKFDINGDWPVYGLPQTIHLDNAKEFRGKMLQRACEQYGINLEWRPVARPNFGAHVERALGTFSQEIHTLPGTTFSNPSMKGEYRSEDKATLTLSEFETWLTDYIVNVYHQKLHSMIDMPPIAKYKFGILGDDENPGTGLPEHIMQPERFKIDLMPYELRTVQDYGIQIDKVYYYDDVIRKWINTPDPRNTKFKASIHN